MSRCFPFPPPGYENKARNDHVDLLAKEKDKEKHKKEKRDKEKREGKERKNKDRSKDKHKEKKDRKEKHRDRKRNKGKDKDKNRTSDDRRIVGRTEDQNEEKLGDSRWKAEGVKDSKFTEELDRRIRDEEKGAVHRMFENFTGSVQRRAEGLGLATAIENERSNGNEMVGVIGSGEQRRNDGLGQPVENNADKKIERKKAKDKETDDRKGDRHKDRDREEKRNKGKDNDRYKEKETEKEKAREKVDHKGNDTPKESGKKYQVDSLNFKPLAPDKDNEKFAGADGNINKKRKDFETNGFLHENDVRPNKFPRPVSSSHPHVENGRTTPHSSIEHGAKNNTKAEKVLDNKEHKINGAAGAQPSSVDPRPSVAADPRQNGGAYLRAPHPDSKYLSQIYIVPKMEWPESDDQEWLFGSDNSRPKLEAEETPRVFASSLPIESLDVFALPYVIPY